MVAALNRYLPRPRNKTGVNLLATTQAEQEEARKKGEADKEKPREYISFLKPFVSIALLDDATSYPSNAVPEHVSTSINTDLSSCQGLSLQVIVLASMRPQSCAAASVAAPHVCCKACSVWSCYRSS